MTPDSEYYYQVATSNVERARTFQVALPGRKSVHVPNSGVNEDLVKSILPNVSVSFDIAIQEAQRIVEYKARRDWFGIGGVSGAVAQLRKIGKPPEDTNGFSSVVRFSIDAVQLVFEDGGVRILNKPKEEWLNLQSTLSGRHTAILTAIARIVAPLTNAKDMQAHLSTAFVMTQYTLRNFTSSEFKDLAKTVGVARMRSVAGGIPFGDNTLIDENKPYEVIMYQHGNQETIARGTDWAQLNRPQCLFGAFEEVVHPLIAHQGKPII